jgi:hypothetical protein
MDYQTLRSRQRSIDEMADAEGWDDTTRYLVHQNLLREHTNDVNREIRQMRADLVKPLPWHVRLWRKLT